MLKNILMLLFAGSLVACGERKREAESNRPEPVIETEIDLNTTGVEGDSLSPDDELVMPHGTGENL